MWAVAGRMVPSPCAGERSAAQPAIRQDRGPLLRRLGSSCQRAGVLAHRQAEVHAQNTTQRNQAPTRLAAALASSSSAARLAASLRASSSWEARLVTRPTSSACSSRA